MRCNPSKIELAMNTKTKKSIIITTVKKWNMDNAKKLKNSLSKDYKVVLLTDKADLIYKNIKGIDPEYIFFPHWSWMIGKDIFNNFKCIVFHMTDLPFGRGGSPLQNLITRDIDKTKISALKVTKDMDGGPVYLKRNLSLTGSAEEIYRRASGIIFKDMIPYILKNNPVPVPQKGRTVIFNRRSSDESRIPENFGLKDVYNKIRMLDAEGYPPAFIANKYLRFEFKGAKKLKGCVECAVRIATKD